MSDSNATSGIQELGTEVLATKSTIANGLASPIRGFRFTAYFEGLGISSFKEVQGFSTEVGVSEYREGGFGFLTSRKLPGLVTYNEITLNKGMYSSPMLYEFFNNYLEGQNFSPVDGKITVYNNAGEPTASWTVINAWPKSYSSSDLSADNGEVIIETLVLAHEGIKRDMVVG